jgi:uncharacterized damage-inducible protein DinB
MESDSDQLSRAMAVEMARYNRWQNEQLYAHCTALGEEALRRDVEIFFGSILATLDHILHVDRVLVRYMQEGRSPDHFDPQHRLHVDFSALRAARVAYDVELEALFRDAAPGWLAEELRFHSERLGRERRIPRAFFATQLFNHQTHHRSQVTTALHRLGIDYGETDLPANPLSQF